MNWDQMEGKWKQYKGKAKEKWGKMTDDDLDMIDGRRQQLDSEDPGTLRHRDGSGKEASR